MVIFLIQYGYLEELKINSFCCTLKILHVSSQQAIYHGPLTDQCLFKCLVFIGTRYRNDIRFAKCPHVGGIFYNIGPT